MSTQDSFRALCESGAVPDSCPSGEPTTVALLRHSAQLSAFSDAVQELHRLSTTIWEGLQPMFAGYLCAGTRILGLNCAAVTQVSSAGFVTCSSSGLAEGGCDMLAARVLEAGETLVRRVGVSSYIGTPVLVGNRVFGVLAFWDSDMPSALPARAAELAVMMARGIAAAIRQSELAATLTGLACQDALTGLPNRLQIERCLQTAVGEARASNRCVGVIFIDLDRFKRINDTWGHAEGDAVLRQIAERLRKAGGDRCIVGRFGGDEFVALLPDIESRQPAVEAAARMLQASRLPLNSCTGDVRIGASAGISIFPDDAADAAALLRCADLAMYAAKRAGSMLVPVAPSDSRA